MKQIEDNLRQNKSARHPIYVLKKDKNGLQRFLVKWLAEKVAETENHPLDNDSSPEIYIASCSEQSPTLEKAFLESLASLAAKGWRIHHVVGLISSEQKQTLTGDLLRMFRFSDKYALYWFDIGPQTVPFELVVIPEKSCFNGFMSLTSPHSIDSGLFITHPDAVRVLQDHFFNMKNRSTLLVRVTRQDKEEWENLIYRIESQVGERLQARELLTTLSAPESIVKEEYKPLGFSDSQVLHLLELHKKRVASLHDQVQRFRFMNIAQLSSVEQFIATGVRKRGNFRAKPQDVLSQIRTEIDWLKKYPNYHTGFTHDQIDVAFMIKGEKVLFEILHSPLNKGDQYIAGEITIESEVLVQDFRKQFEQMWMAIPDKFRKKEHVITWLEGQLAKSSYLREK